MPDGLPTQLRVCAICTKHLGSDPRSAKKRDDDHFEQWQYDMDVALEDERLALHKREAEIADLEATILRLRDELAARPMQVVHRNLDQETVDDAEHEREQAFRARDAAFSLVARFRGLHHDTGRGTCKCGTPVGTCRATKIIDGSPSFRRWEARQCENLRRNNFSELPAEHPACTNPRWVQPSL